MEYHLNAKLRTIIGKQVKTLRSKGVVPAVLYGKKAKDVILEIASGEFEKLYRQAGQSTLVNLNVEGGESVKVLITDIYRDPLTEIIGHIDFYQVDMSEKIKAKIPIVLVGESRAVKELGAVLTKTLQEIEVECLPLDLPHQIEISLEPLKEFGDMIRVSSLTPPKGVEIHDKPDTVIATVEAVKEEKVEEVSKEAEQASISATKTEQDVKKDEKATKEALEKEIEKK